MTWTQQHDQEARAEGWRLAPTIDNGDTGVYLMVAAASQQAGEDSKHAQNVRARAAMGSALHVAALQTVAASLMNRTRKAKK